MGINFPGVKNPDVITPHWDALYAEGLELPDAYAYRFCSPSRGAFLTGRYAWRLPQTRCNFIPAYIQDGTPLGYTMLPARLAAAGYVSTHAGKWHQGCYAPQFLPRARGFNYTDGFLSGGEDHYSLAADLGVGNCGNASAPAVRDAWAGDAPLPSAVGTWTAERFTAFAVTQIATHAARHGDAPLFLYAALHNTHAPLEAPQRFLDLYPGVNFTAQRAYYAMVSAVDESIGNVTGALRAAGLWDNSLVVVMTDNGAPVTVGGSNYPLRGGKGSNWEGGVRVPAVVTGGLLPPARRGAVAPGLFHILDLYATFLALAGLPPDDPSPAAQAPVDALNAWPWLSGAAPSSPRQSLVLDHAMYAAASGGGVTGALRRGRHKLLVGGPAGEPQASWYGWFSPNASVPRPSMNVSACANAAGSPGGCLFDVVDDPGEHVDLAASQPALFQALLAEFASYNASYHPPVNNPVSDKAGLCAAAAGSDWMVRPWRSEPVPEGGGSPQCE
jgi:arylsulfatase B